MNSILISLNSWGANKERYLRRVLDYYADNFGDYSVDVVLSTTYPFKYDKLPVTPLPQVYSGHAFCWNNRKYILENGDKYSFVLDSDDDMLLTRENLAYYIANESLPLDYVPGFLSYEEARGEKWLLTVNSTSLCMWADEFEIYQKQFVTPSNLHSALFLVDKPRFDSIKGKLSSEPTKSGKYTVAEWARTEPYSVLKKAVSVEEIVSGGALVEHLPKKYASWNYTFLMPRVLFPVKEPKREIVTEKVKIARLANTPATTKPAQAQVKRGGCGCNGGRRTV
jgi:hypothetical protein